MSTAEVKPRSELLPDRHVHLAFDRECVTLPLEVIIPLKSLRDGVHDSKKYAQVVRSIKVVGLVEAPVVFPDPKDKKRYFLLDGHLRIEALKELKIATVDCLVATDEETYTYNKRINRLSPIQEHRMIARAVERGIPRAKIAHALGIGVQTISKRVRLLEGICPEATEMLKATNCPVKVFDVLRRMSSQRQVEAVDLMIGQNNFTSIFAHALLAATPDDQLMKRRQKADAGANPSSSSQQIARMERELAVLQTRIKSIEDTYGVDNLHLTVARGYIAKLLLNRGIARWLAQNRQEYLPEFQSIAEIETLTEAPVQAD